jgi:hypothetical protein
LREDGFIEIQVPKKPNTFANLQTARVLCATPLPASGRSK